jgi:von Willebrand factor type A domain
MSVRSPHAAPLPERMRPAWGTSILFHAAALTLLAVAIRPWPHGGAGGANHSISIELNPSSAASDLHDGEQRSRSDADTPQAMPEPPALLATPSPDVVQAARKDETRQTLPVKFAAAPVVPAAATTTSTSPGTGQSPPGNGRGGSPGGSRPTTVNVFGVEGQGSKFVYLFDRSASMEGAPLTAAKRQLLRSMQSLGSIHQFHIVFFNTETYSFDAVVGGGRNAFATDRNKQLAANFVNGITSEGGTDRMIALRAAIAYSPDVIFFLTDADDPMSDSEMAEIGRLNGRARAAICVIEFGRTSTPSPDNFLMRLARESGGRYGYINTATLSR